MTHTRITNLALGAALAFALIGGTAGHATAKPITPQYDTQGRLIFPSDYREWVFLSSGLDMSYSKTQPMKGAHMFNNVFVPRADYDAFKKTGSWPDKTVLMLENRGGVTNRSILKHGQVQTQTLMGLEVHVKDKARFKGGWAFFSYDRSLKPAKRIGYTESCYSCHLAHGAADTTFVQFYPTLLPVATKLKTLAGGYLNDIKSDGGK